ncbi:MAG TPA: CapA family protein [Tepidiformaceae bacterium]|nr:CapA family protein [Tepidiformaceae bacterium]
MTLAAVGDIMLARSIGERVLADGPSVVFAGVEPQLSSADITVGNLETSISDEGTPAAKGYTFRAPPATAAALKAGGFDVISQANNHALDYGPAALADTRRLVQAQGIDVVGAGAGLAEAVKPAILERNGLRVAFLGFVDTQAEGSYSEADWAATASTPGVAWATPNTIRTAVQAAKTEADVVVVMLHAGVEYATEPTALQETLAEAAIDAGAALVLGAHPHVLQPVVAYHGGVIAFSLGNFVFDGFDPPANTTAIFDATLTAGGVQSWKLVPVNVVDGLPVLQP